MFDQILIHGLDFGIHDHLNLLHHAKASRSGRNDILWQCFLPKSKIIQGSDLQA